MKPTDRDAGRKLFANALSLVVCSTLALSTALWGSAAFAVSQTADDAPGTSSITGGTNWSDSLPPSSGKDYDSARFLRSSATTTFAGDSLSMLAGGVLVFDTDAITLTVDGLHLVGGGRITLLGDPNLINVTLDGSLSLDNAGNNSVADGNLDAGESLTIDSDISGIGRLRVGADPGGQVLLTGTNTYTGGTSIKVGAILEQVGAASLPGSGAPVLTHGESRVDGTLRLNSDASVAALVGGAAGLIDNVGGGVIGFTMGSSTVADSTYNGVIDEGTGTVDVTKVGDNRQILTGDNDYSGGTTISGGQLRVSGATADLGGGAVDVTGSSSTLELDSVGTGGSALGNTVDLEGRADDTTAHIDNVGGSSELSGLITLADDGTAAQDNFNLAATAGTLDLTGGVTASGATDAPLLNLSGGAGATGSISGGVALNGAGSAINQSGAADWNIDSVSLLDAMDASGTGTLTVGAVSIATGDLALSGDGDGVVTGAVTLGGAGSAINKSGTGDWSLSGSVGGLDAINADGTGILTANDVTGVGGLALGGSSLNGVLTGTIAPNGDLDKNDAGTWTVDGTVNGTATAVNVNDGTLALGASADVSAVPLINVGADGLLDATAVVSGSNGGFDLASGETLAGSGTISGNVTGLSSSSLKIGEPSLSDIATLTFTGDLTLDSGSNLIIDIDPTGTGTIDFLSVAGLLTIGSGLGDFHAFIVPPAVSLDDPAYVFAEYGDINGAFNPLDAPTGYTFDYTYGGNNEIALVRVPSPAPLGLIGLGALAMVGLRRRAKR